MNVRDLDTTHARLLDVAAAWGRLEGSAQWYTLRIAERVHAMGIDPYDLTFADLALELAEAAQGTREHPSAPAAGADDNTEPSG